MLTIPNEIFNSMEPIELYESCDIEKLIKDGLISEIENEIICDKIYDNLSFKQIGVKYGLTTNNTGQLFKKAFQCVKQSLILSEKFSPKIIQLDKELALINLNKRKISLSDRLNSHSYERYHKKNDTYNKYLLKEIELIDKQIEIISEIETSDSLRSFNFTTRTANSLYRNSIISIKQLKYLIDTDELQNVRDLGQIGINEVNDTLRKFN